MLIAEIVGADGIRPYLSRPGKYSVRGEDDRNLRNFIIPERADRQSLMTYERGTSGDWTWPLFCIFKLKVFPMEAMAIDLSTAAGKSSDYRRAVRALDDAGLLKLTVGPRGGFGTATFEWLPAAYLAAVERKEKFHNADSQFLCDVMALVARLAGPVLDRLSVMFD